MRNVDAVPPVGTFANVAAAPLGVVCCHWNVNEPATMPLTSAMPVVLAVSVVSTGSSTAGAVIVGTPVGGVCGAAAVAVPVSATTCVDPAVLPESFVATRFAVFAPAGASGLNDTCTLQLPARGSVVVHVVAPREKFPASVPVRVNPVRFSALRPLLRSVNVFVPLVVPISCEPNAPSVTGVSVASGAI